MAEIGLGLAALGRPGYLNLGHGEDLGDDRSPAALERRAHEVMDAAFEDGVRWFDAARSYGRAEAFLASWLASRGLKPGEVVVSSKWGYTYTANWQVEADPPEVKDLSIDTFRRQLAESRELLGDHLALYQIHSATSESRVLEDDAVLGALAELRADGVQVGFTTTGPRQAETIDRALEVGGFDAVQATWNLLEPSAGGALARAHEAGLRVIVKEAVANGRLTARGVVEPLAAVAARLRVPEDAIAIAAVLTRPWADVVLSGAGTAAQVGSNLEAREVALDEAALAELCARAEESEAYWRTRGELAWT